jgi:hypothetical protein
MSARTPIGTRLTIAHRCDCKIATVTADTFTMSRPSRFLKDRIMVRNFSEGEWLVPSLPRPWASASSAGRARFWWKLLRMMLPRQAKARCCQGGYDIRGSDCPSYGSPDEEGRVVHPPCMDRPRPFRRCLPNPVLPSAGFSLPHSLHAAIRGLRRLCRSPCANGIKPPFTMMAHRIGPVTGALPWMMVIRASIPVAT